ASTPLTFLIIFYYIFSWYRRKKTYDISLYKRGDLLEVSRTLFKHFGIYLGEGRVAHFIPDILPVFTKEKSITEQMVTNERLILGVLAKAASVRVDSLVDFAYGDCIQVNKIDSMVSVQPLNGEEVARRSEKLIGSFSYSLLWHNCEHYVMYCRYGVAFSFQTFQVRKLKRWRPNNSNYEYDSLVHFEFLICVVNVSKLRFIYLYAKKKSKYSENCL
uniref:LRAT domain-containing protein n=1 Tax=Sinocyclocheilus grahami TaxID=75366 RepID=A0A672PZN8_SINGR